MGPEINADPILALEKRIEKGLGDTIQLKRARNSLLNISALVPPELLGQVFRWNAIPDYGFGELEKGSYNFLLVCHHWFEVASGTPELWTYWGNTLKLWLQRYQRSGTAPLDLILHAQRRMGDEDVITFDRPLQDALRDRAARDSIRSIHLRGRDTDLLDFVISLLVLGDKSTRDSSIESLRLEHTSSDVSTFLTRYRFPRLRDLRLLTDARITSWDYLKIQAPSLIALSLGFSRAPNNPTTSQLLAILASYPNLQQLVLYETMIPHDGGDGSTPRVRLCCLKELVLMGNYRHVFQLLDQLEYPDTLDSVHLHLSECAGESLSELLGPYLRDRVQRDGRFQDRLGIQVSCSSGSISFSVNAFGESNIPTALPKHGYPSMLFSAVFSDNLPRGAVEKLCSNIIAVTPRERVVRFIGGLSVHTMRDLLVAMPNVEDLYLMQSVISDTFLRPDPLSNTKLLPSLRRLCLDYFTLQNGDGDWRPMIGYLIHQTSGDQDISLRLIHGRNTPIPPEIVGEIKGLVSEFIHQ